MIKLDGMSEKQRIYWAYECFYSELKILHCNIGNVKEEIDQTKMKNLSNSDILDKVDFVSRSMEEFQENIRKMREMKYLSRDMIYQTLTSSL